VHHHSNCKLGKRKPHLFHRGLSFPVINHICDVNPTSCPDSRYLILDAKRVGRVRLSFVFAITQNRTGEYVLNTCVIYIRTV
jgi:hypothetical protein